MNIIKTVCTATVVLMTGMLTSCSDYLDVSKELAQNLDKEEVFSKPKYIKNGKEETNKHERTIRDPGWMF